MSTVKPTRWGIVGAGWISSKFLLDLLIDPSTREVTDVKHEVYAVASRDLKKCKAWMEEQFKEGGVEGTEKVVAYGSYQELFEDPNVDVVYIGTPHSHHYQQVHAALTAGKNVLCEKSFTANADQAKALVKLAREKDLFLMEAVWLRFQPFSYKLQEILRSGVIGSIRGVQAELNIDFTEKAKADPKHRLVNPDLAGGSLLDLGPYPWTQLILALMPEPSTGEAHPLPKIAASMTKTFTNVDCNTTATIQFKQPDGTVLNGTMTCAQDVQSPHRRVSIIQGDKGFVEVHWATYRPEGLTYAAWASPTAYGDQEEPTRAETISFVPRPGGIWGFGWEADEVARCLAAGKKESERMPLRDTILMMEVFDEIRKQGEFVLPEAVETLELQ